MEDKKRRPRLGNSPAPARDHSSNYPNRDNERTYSPRERRPYDRDNHSYNDRDRSGNDRERSDDGGERRSYGGGGYNRGGGGYNRGGYRGGGGYNRKPKREFIPRPPEGEKPEMPTGEGMPLNKFVAHCGAASRRKAVEVIKEGKVTVNGSVVDEPFYRLEAGDTVAMDGQTLEMQEKKIYLLFNKPKKTATVAKDERDFQTVMDFIDPFFPETLKPVGHLGKYSTGLMVVTNDQEMDELLTNPEHNIFKQYRVTLERNFRHEDMAALERGVQLEDGESTVRWARLAEGKPHVVELEVVSNNAGAVSEIFETLGYRVKKMDRFYIGGLTKKGLERGKFRHLTQKEIMAIKHFATSMPSDGAEEDHEGED